MGVWFFISLLLFFILNPLDTVTVEFRDTARIINGIIYIIIFSVLLVIEKRLFNLYNERKNEITLIVLYFFIFSSLAALVQGIFGVIQFHQENFQDFWTGSTFIFGSIGVYFLAYFNIEVFKKGINAGNNRKYLIFLFIIIIITNVLNTHKMMDRGSDLEYYITLLILFIFTLTEFTKLTKHARYLSIRMETPIEKKSFQYIALSGIFVISTYIGLIIYTITSAMPVRFFNTIALFIGYMLLYFGFVMPMKKKADQ